VRENPIVDKEMREIKRQRVEKPMGDGEAGGGGGGEGGEWEMKR
jgi:hypothetical protein